MIKRVKKPSPFSPTSKPPGEEERFPTSEYLVRRALNVIKDALSHTGL